MIDSPKVRERYCPECKQSVPVHDVYVWDTCTNCTYEFGVVVDKDELESFVKLTEQLILTAQTIAKLALPNARPMPESIPTVTAQFRKKYLEK